MSVKQLDGTKDFSGSARLLALVIAPLAPIAAVLVGTTWTAILPATLIFALLAVVSSRVEDHLRPVMISVSLMGSCIALTSALAGHPWQIDTHMLYYASLAVIATMGSLKALVTAVLITLVHHLTFGLLMPTLVFPEMPLFDTLGRIALHGAIWVLEAGILVWWMTRSAAADAAVREGREQLAATLAQAEQAKQEAEAARISAVATADRTRREGQRAAAAVEQIATAAEASADHASNAQSVMTQTRDEADRSSEVVTRAHEAMDAIKSSSEKITTIIGVIDEIARQTDLLALNAAVESARAGEAGRGFAVVATEVRKLAQRSADASKEIRDLVITSSEQVDHGVTLVGETGDTLSRIAGAVSDLNDVLSQIVAGAADQSEGLAQVNVAIARIDTIRDDCEEDALQEARPSAKPSVKPATKPSAGADAAAAEGISFDMSDDDDDVDFVATKAA